MEIIFHYPLYKKSIMPCIENFELFPLTTGTSCNLKGGIKTAYWTLRANVDFNAMAGDALQFDQPNETILAYTMLNSEKWHKIDALPKSSTYSAEYTDDNGFYENLLTFVFEGKGAAFRNAMCKAIKACKVLVQIYDYNCESRLFGIDWDGSSFNNPIDTFKIIRHADLGGTLGGDNAKDEVDIGGETECPPLYVNIDKTTFETNYVN